jgi:hypothetical protein
MGRSIVRGEDVAEGVSCRRRDERAPHTAARMKKLASKSTMVAPDETSSQ